MLFTAGLVALVAAPMALAQRGGSVLVGTSLQFIVRYLTDYVGELAFPPSRGSDAAVARIGPCQGYEIGGRVEYPLNGGRVSWTATRDIEDITLAYATKEDASSQDDFTNISSNFGRGYVGSRCVEGPDFAALGFSAGDQVTLQWSFKAGPQKSQSFEVSAVRRPLRGPGAYSIQVRRFDFGLTFRFRRFELFNVLRE
jgi:hypothetical protein